MRSRYRIGSFWAALALVGTVMAWASPSFADGDPPGPPPPTSGQAVVELAHSPEGLVLVTGPGATKGAGLALYEFSGDAFPSSVPLPPVPLFQFHCTSSNTTARFPGGSGTTGCTTPWPPLMASGTLVAGPGVDQSGLSVAGPNSGFTPGQVEYFGHPLYTFVKDSASANYNGEDVAVFGGVFWLASRNGQPDPGVAQVGTEVSPSGTALSSTMANGGRTLYLLSYDTPGPSPSPGGPPARRNVGPAQTTCLVTTGCAAIWPPLLTTGRPTTGPGVDPRLVGTVRRPDGTTQVTYAGWPVYLYFADQAPGAAAGETNGQYLLDNHADGVWLQVAPQGGPDPGTAMVTTETDGLLAVSSAAFPPAPFGNPVATVYTLSTDTTPGTSSCTGTCAKYWPPVLTSTAPDTSSPTFSQASAVGTIQRPDGTFQVTYNGHPLYFFSQDLTSGDSGGASITTPFGTFSVVMP